MLYVWIGIVVAFIVIGFIIVQAFRSNKPVCEPPPSAAPAHLAVLLPFQERSARQVEGIINRKSSLAAKRATAASYYLGDSHLGASEDRPY